MMWTSGWNPWRCVVAWAIVAVAGPLQAQSIFSLRHADATGGALRALAASDSLLVAVGDHGRVLTSTDGQTWRPGTAGITDTLRGVAFGAGQFIAVGDRGRVVMSSDGAQWRDVSPAGAMARLNAVGFAGGLFVAVGEQGTILTSPDGVNWSARDATVLSSLRAIAAIQSQPSFVVSGDSGLILTSSDGVEWMRRDAGTTDDLVSLSSTGWAILRASGSLIGFTRTTTAAGSTWSTPPGPPLPPGNWRAVATRTDGVLVTLAVGESGSVAVGSVSVQPYESGTTQHLHAATFARGTFFAVGDGETILQGFPDPTSPTERLRNLSNRSPVAGGSATLISGFVVAGTGAKRLLIRAPGPSLGTFGVTAPLAQPTLTLFDASGRVLARNTGWSGTPDQELVRESTAFLAFPFPENSADAALVVSLPPGAYTAHVTAATNGVGLVELYDADRWPLPLTSRLSNMSSRCFVGTGESVAITGLAMPQGRKLLIRAVGPTLGSNFGVGGALANPRLEIIRPQIPSGARGGSPLPALSIVVNDDWTVQSELKLGANSDGTLRPIVGVSWRGSPEEIREATRACGAFPLPEDSKDAAMLVTFDYSPMTVHISGADGGTGIALVEIYEVGER